MSRLIKRYGSRKLYDTHDSRYVSLEEIASLVRGGQEVRVIDNKSKEDVTAAVLTQILSEEGRSGESTFSPPFLHDLLRFGESTVRRGEQALRKGERVVEAGLKQARENVDDLVHRTVDRLRPGAVSEIRAEVERLRERLATLDEALNDLDDSGHPGESTANSTSSSAT